MSKRRMRVLGVRWLATGRVRGEAGRVGLFEVGSEETVEVVDWFEFLAR
jgi:hypothetical protein